MIARISLPSTARYDRLNVFAIFLFMGTNPQPFPCLSRLRKHIYCVFGIVVDRLLLESPLADAPQVNGNTLLISKLGTEIVALALHFSFDYATIVADSAI